ncbi:MAG: type II secretion system protein GspN [Deltaproteobacteria bacterium]|nr:type II secretion system protein GspN [Deltaproteobacteria bacterium]
MKERLVKIGKWALYPLFYLLCLGLFGYLTFPFGEVRRRIIAEFDRTQQSAAPGASPMQLRIGELSGFWLTGIEVADAALLIPAARGAAAGPSFGTGAVALPGGADAGAATAPPTEIRVKRAHARVRLLPLVLGRIRIDFAVEAFGGELRGTLPYGARGGDVELELDAVQLDEIAPLRAKLGLPVLGTATGKLLLSPEEGMFHKASGELELRVADVQVGDGKAKLAGIALPAAKLGQLTIAATAKNGLLKLTQLAANGPDLELVGEGTVRVREPWSRARADLQLRFRFTDRYRDKDELTRSLLGKPGSAAPALLDLDPRIKRSRRADGFYGWRIQGPLGGLRFEPQGARGSRVPPDGLERGLRPGAAGRRPFAVPRFPSVGRAPATGEDEATPGTGGPPSPPPAAATPPGPPGTAPPPAPPGAPSPDATAGGTKEEDKAGRPEGDGTERAPP